MRLLRRRRGRREDHGLCHLVRGWGRGLGCRRAHGRGSLVARLRVGRVGIDRVDRSIVGHVGHIVVGRNGARVETGSYRVVGVDHSLAELADIAVGDGRSLLLGMVVDYDTHVLEVVAGCCSHDLGKTADRDSRVLDRAVGCMIDVESGRLNRSMELGHDFQDIHMGFLDLDPAVVLVLWRQDLHMDVAVPACDRLPGKGRCNSMRWQT